MQRLGVSSIVLDRIGVVDGHTLDLGRWKGNNVKIEASSLRPLSALFHDTECFTVDDQEERLNGAGVRCK
jgi:hypothetical protein